MTLPRVLRACFCGGDSACEVSCAVHVTDVQQTQSERGRLYVSTIRLPWNIMELPLPEDDISYRKSDPSLTALTGSNQSDYDWTRLEVFTWRH